MSDFHVTIRVKNNHLLSRRAAWGFSQKDMAAAIGIPFTTYTGFERCSESPLKDGYWSKKAQAVADFYEVHPSVLWTDAVIALQVNKVEKVLTGQQLMELSNPGSALEQLAAKNLSVMMARVLETLNPREKEVMLKRFVEDKTLDEIGADCGRHRETVRQIEAKALRKLRHPSRTRGLILATGSSVDVTVVEGSQEDYYNSIRVELSCGHYKTFKSEDTPVHTQCRTCSEKLMSKLSF